ncbi:MAG: ATP-dependent helicase, partial [Opitutaceae bacterium]
MEFWFSKLENDWAGAFTQGQLEQGREIYRDGQVRELELTDKDAIVHRRVEKKDEYAVIEWTETGLNVRSSTTDPDLAHALAVAGLHEIEELVADEISALPKDIPVTPGHGANGNGNGHGNGSQPADGHGPGQGNGNGNGNGYGVGAGSAGAKRTVGGGLAAAKRDGGRASEAGAGTTGRSETVGHHDASRTLALVFKTKTAGLTFQATWLDADKKTKHPALGHDAHANGNGHVTSGERAKLIGLAAYARKAHFHYNQDTGVYLMESLVEIPNFLKTVLPAWRRLFAIELDEKAGNLLKGTRAVEIEAVAERSAGGGGGSGNATLNLRWIFRAGERMLTDSEVSTLLRRNGQPVILPSLGIVALAQDKWDSFAAWQRNVEET